MSEGFSRLPFIGIQHRYGSVRSGAGFTRLPFIGVLHRLGHVPGSQPPQPQPTPTPAPDPGGAGGIVGGRRPEYKSTLEHYRRILAREERQEEIRQLDELLDHVNRLASQQARETAEYAAIQAGMDRLLDEMAEMRERVAIAKRIAELNTLAAIEARRRDDEAALAIIFSLS